MITSELVGMISMHVITTVRVVGVDLSICHSLVWHGKIS